MAFDLKRGFQSLVGGKVLTSLIGLLTLPLVVRVLGPGNYGDYAFLMSTFGLMMLFVSPPITEGVQKFVAEDRSHDDWQQNVVGFYLRLAVLLAAVGSAGVAVGASTGFVGRLLDPRFQLFFYFLAGHVVVIQLQNFTRHTLLGLGLEHFSESFSVLGKFLTRVGGLALAAAGLGVVGFLVSELVSAAVIIVAGFLVLRRRVSLVESLRSRSTVPVRELLSFNGLNMVSVDLMVSLFHVDIMMLRIMQGDASTGYYKAALVLAEYIWIIPGALQSLMLHSASRLWSQDRRDRIESLASALTRYVFLATSLLAVGIFVLADSFVPLYYGPDFRASIRPLAYLLPGTIGFALARPLYGINKATSRLVPVVAALSVAAVINAVGNYLLIPTYGLLGAAVATSTSYGSMFVLQVACARYLGYAPLTGVRPVRLLATVALAGPVIVGVDAVIAPDLAALLFVPPVGFLVFTGVAVWTGALDESELREATSALPSPIGRRLRSIVFGRE